jgi:hypothetical protein
VDIIDLFWNTSQDSRIRDVRDEVDRLRVERDLAGTDARRLVEENAALRLRLGLLVRLLIAKGVITAAEYAALIAEAQPASPNGSA